jgi:signal transduction histidine kinase
LQRLSETLNNMLERLETAFRRITRFTADASHELRTPVALMRTRAELALRKPRAESEYREALAQNLQELERTSDLIEKLMLLARANSGAEALQRTPLDLTGLVHEAYRQGQELGESEQLVFQQNLPSQPLWIEGDAHSLRRLFLILIDNAVKYTPAHGQITVSLASRDGFAFAEVSDTGIGIAEEDLPHIFERFYRTDKARSRESGGAGGLGLSIALWIAQAHGGTLKAESKPEAGSVFYLRIPLTRTPAPENL